MGKLIFLIIDQLQKVKLTRQTNLRMVTKEQNREGKKRRMSAVLWDMFTGSAPYKEVFFRTLHPLFGKTADVNFVESTKFLERISRTSEENGPGMQHLAKRLDKVDPEVRSRFAELTTEVHRNAQQRLAAAERRDRPPAAESPASASSAMTQRR